MAQLFQKFSRQQLARFLPDPDLIRMFEALQDQVANGGGGGSGITALSGDVTAGPGSGLVTATIAAKAVGYSKIQDVTATARVLGRKSSGAGMVEELAAADILAIIGPVGGIFPKGADWDASPLGTINPAGASVVFTGPAQAAGTILGAYAIGDVGPSSATVEVWKKAGAKPTSADKISGTNPITLSAATSSVDTALTGWTKTVAAGDRFGFKVLTSTVFNFLGVCILIG